MMLDTGQGCFLYCQDVGGSRFQVDGRQLSETLPCVHFRETEFVTPFSVERDQNLAVIDNKDVFRRIILAKYLCSRWILERELFCCKGFSYRFRESLQQGSREMS